MANNPYVNKVVFGSATLVDLTGTTATADKILSGYGAFGADGAWMDGTATASSGSGVVWQDSQGYVHLSDEGDIPLQTKSVSPSETAQTVTPDTGYYALDKVNVGAISSSYVGSGITRRSSSDLTASGATVTAPAGYYASSASKSVATGTAGTPTATKGSVSNHAVSVTPSVTNTTGYITGGTKTGTAVSVSASELVSGTYSVTGSGTKDVTNYASVSVPSGTEGTPTASKGTVSNHSVSVTPSVTNSGGYITGSTKTGTAVSVSASELVSGTKSITENGTGIDVTNYASVDVAVPSSTPTLITKSITANGTYNASSDNADGYSSVTVNVSGGGGITPEPKKQINFIDYDGTILHSYTKTEWQSVTALPSNPSHTGLTAQGWNWTKAQIDAQLTAAPDGDVWVGQMYVTTSGDTEIDVRFVDSARLSPTMTIAVNGTVTVDWGDNTTADTVTGSSITTMQDVPHTYASVGNYTIKIHVTSGSFRFYGSSSAYTLLRKNNTADENRVYSNCVKTVRLGNNVTSIGNYAFCHCYSLASITIPSNVTSIGNYAFWYCYSLASITIPSNVTSIGNSAFSYCNSLASITIPSNVTSIGLNAFSYCYSLASITIPSSVKSINNYAFSYCYSLASITIPSSVKSIGSNVFNNCYGMAEYHILPTTVPTLGTTAFNNIVSDCVIYVPTASLSDYQTASNWSAYASYMVGE